MSHIISKLNCTIYQVNLEFYEYNISLLVNPILLYLQDTIIGSRIP